MSLISRRFHDFSDHEQFYDCETIILNDICITKFVNPSSAGDFACSAGELEIKSESWSFGIKQRRLAIGYKDKQKRKEHNLPLGSSKLAKHFVEN